MSFVGLETMGVFRQNSSANCFARLFPKLTYRGTTQIDRANSLEPPFP